MNSIHIARNLLSTKSSQPVCLRLFSSKAIPTSSTVQIGGVKVIGLPHLSTPSMRWAENKKHWLSSPETYPLIAILGGAGVFVCGFITYFLITAPDVQISPIKRKLSETGNELVYT